MAKIHLCLSCNHGAVKGLHIPRSNILCTSSKKQVSGSSGIPSVYCQNLTDYCGCALKGPFLSSGLVTSHVSLTLTQQVRGQLQRSLHASVTAEWTVRGGGGGGVGGDTTVSLNTYCRCMWWINVWQIVFAEPHKQRPWWSVHVYCRSTV